MQELLAAIQGLLIQRHLGPELLPAVTLVPQLRERLQPSGEKVLEPDRLRRHVAQQLEAQLAVGPLWKPPIADLMFTGPVGRPLMGTSVTRQFKTALARHGLAPLRFHHLRHLHGSLMLASGVDLATVSHMLGHSSVALTASSTYAGFLPTLRDDAVARLERLLSRSS
jgi:integrase